MKVGYIPAKFDSHIHSHSGDIMVLVYHVISQDYLSKRSCVFLGWSPSR